MTPLYLRRLTETGALDLETAKRFAPIWVPAVSVGALAGVGAATLVGAKPLTGALLGGGVVGYFLYQFLGRTPNAQPSS